LIAASFFFLLKSNLLIDLTVDLTTVFVVDRVVRDVGLIAEEVLKGVSRGVLQGMSKGVLKGVSEVGFLKTLDEESEVMKVSNIEEPKI
jgi:hypothetical protein